MPATQSRFYLCTLHFTAAMSRNDAVGAYRVVADALERACKAGTRGRGVFF